MFDAKRADGRAQWRVVADLAKARTPGDLITYIELGELLETEDRKRLYQVVAAANRRLWAKSQRSLAVMPRIGYRILKAEEHEIQATSYQVKARRRMDNAVSIMRATDLAALNPRQRDWTLQVTASLVLMARMIDDHDARLARHDDLIRELQEGLAETRRAAAGLPPDPAAEPAPSAPAE
jgi:hypothetical protein